MSASGGGGRRGSGPHFAKMSGAGNDFILIDAREGSPASLSPEWIRRLCARRLGVGADGLILLLPAGGSGLGMRYFNADGSEAAMCGNGGRCLARFAVLLGAAREQDELAVVSGGQTYGARVDGRRVRLSLGAPAGADHDLALDAVRARPVDFIRVGVPHTVLYSEDVDAEDVAALGRAIRHHPRFSPEGTNVNFFQVLDPHRARIRTFERGVEDETLACGTGTAAAVLLAHRRGLVAPPVAVTTRGGDILEMDFTADGDGVRDIRQTGEARLVYWGEFTEETDAFGTRPEG